MMMPSSDRTPSGVDTFLSNLLAPLRRAGDCDHAARPSANAAAVIPSIASLLHPVPVHVAALPSAPPARDDSPADPPPKPRQKRQMLDANAITEMRGWLVMNWLNPYPPRVLKEIWSQRFGMTPLQINTFLANTRQRVLRSIAARRVGGTIRAQLNGVPVEISFDL
jgi:hypothetical protein